MDLSDTKSKHCFTNMYLYISCYDTYVLHTMQQIEKDLWFFRICFYMWRFYLCRCSYMYGNYVCIYIEMLRNRIHYFQE